MKPKVYLASGWFNEDQKKQMNEVYETLRSFENTRDIDLFAPFYDGFVLRLDDPGIKKKMALTWWLDIEKIKESDILIACTQDHDVGTIFECGYASARGIPILCYNSNEELGLNLMLAQEARGFCKSQSNLREAITDFIKRWWIEQRGGKFNEEWRYNEFQGEPI